MKLFSFNSSSIEVVGLPGAGKTTFFLNNRDYTHLFSPKSNFELNINNKIKTRLLFITILVVFLVSSPSQIRFIFYSKKKFWIFKKLAYRLTLNSLSQFKKPRLESGMLQVILTDAVEHCDHDEISFYVSVLALFQMPKTIFIFRNEPSICLQRFIKRGNSERREISSAQIKSLNLKNFELGERILNIIHAKAIDNNSEIFEYDLSSRKSK